jgi:hypothetical protein
MPTCPRCEANVPDDNDRCRVCGYGLPGTDAEKTDPKRIEPVVAAGAIRDDTTGVHASRDDVTGQTEAVAPIYRAPSRLYPASAILLAFICAVAIVLTTIALTSGNGSDTRSDFSTTTSTSMPAAVATTTTERPTTTTVLRPTTTTYYYPPPTERPTTTTAAPVTTTTLKKPPTTTTSKPTTTTTSHPTTTTTSTTTSLPPPTSTSVRHHH